MFFYLGFLFFSTMNLGGTYTFSESSIYTYLAIACCDICILKAFIKISCSESHPYKARCILTYREPTTFS